MADHKALSKYLKTKIAFINEPESHPIPFDEIRDLRIKYNNKGLSDKKNLTRNMLQSGFSLANAAAHPNCPSAAYFLGKLQLVGNIQPSAKS